MLFYTHVLFSILVASIVRSDIYFISFAALFSLLADIDKSRSFIGIPIFSSLIGFFLGHRRIFHSILFMVFGYLIINMVSGFIALAFVVGFGSHLFLDALTKEGIIPFYPLKFRVKGVIKTGGIFEMLLFLLLTLALVYVILINF